MPRIEDFNSFSVGSKSLSNENSFVSDLGYLDIEFKNVPEEIKDIDEAKAQIEYSAIVQRDKKGINNLDIRINTIELEIEIDDYPNDRKEYEFEIIPGANIDANLVIPEKLAHYIPTYPSKMEVDMKKSMEPKDFRIIVYFGEDHL